ncbi:hypothetical protein ACFOZY_03310 [Chungangia koreensis]|uniref:Uncharacterized protein n=1 Tax=Chungangia koreensis TaxID=752657 RepID=A0ABV8X5E1_9LACT
MANKPINHGLLGVGAWQLVIHFAQSAALTEYFFNVRNKERS